MNPTKSAAEGPNGRVAIVDGCRTPFAKAMGELAERSSLDLSVAVVDKLADRNGVREQGVQSLVLGSVMMPEKIPYLARQTSLALGWDDMDAYSEEYACATGARAVVSGAYQILTGEYEVVIAGGAESLSQRPVEVTSAAREIVLRRPRPSLANTLLSIRAEDLLPNAPGTVEPYSGRTLLEHAEDMVGDWGIARSDADALSLRSHVNADRAWNAGLFDDEVVPVELADGRVMDRDGLVRGDSSAEAMAKLKPVHADGTITAGNASRLTDGASAVLMMSERAAEERGCTPRAFLSSWAFTGQDPKLGALIGPVFAMRAALDRAGLALSDCDIVDFHEAFAGQVLANLAAMRSEEFADRHMPGTAPLGEIPEETFNVNGGSIALGHPFGATGGRLVTQSVNELVRRRAKHSAIAICAGGARGAALIFEAP